ncbi:MAG: hypothetical protein RBR42_04970 [Desulfomicrobium sp.]|nr:hypothetical protein [Desulfomicrobium sp.]
MTEQQFSYAAMSIANFLGASVPSETKIYTWFPKVSHIPSEAVGYITQKLTDELERMPANFPKVFLEKFHQWQRDNPQKQAKEREQGCQDCEAGLLWLYRKKNGKIETTVKYCQCYAGFAGHIGRVSLAQAEAAGWISRKWFTFDGGPSALAIELAKKAAAQERQRVPHWQESRQ